jgi:hypothetical protein
MGLDLRLPIGLYFTLLGLLLGAYGIFTRTDKAMYQCSLDININLAWGAVLLVFGLAMLVPALIDRKNKAGK